MKDTMIPFTMTSKLLNIDAGKWLTGSKPVVEMSPMPSSAPSSFLFMILSVPDSLILFGSRYIELIAGIFMRKNDNCIEYQICQVKIDDLPQMCRGPDPSSPQLDDI